MAFQAGAAVAKFNLDTKNYEQGQKTINSGNSAIAKGAKVAGSIVAAAGAVIASALVKAVFTANEFQKSFSNVNTLVDQTKVNTQEMAKELLTMDGRLGSAKELTDGLYQALSASVDPAKAVKFVGEAAKFAGAALISTNSAVDVITTGLNAYGLQADSATSISDKLFSVIKLGKTTGDELASTLGKSIPIAANMGISFDELGASIVIMTRQGISAAEATTKFNAITKAFLKPSTDMQAALEKIGYESGSMAIESLGLKGALDAVIKSTDGSKEALSLLLPDAEGLTGALALTGEGGKEFNNVLKELQNSAGATEIAFNKQEKTFETFKNTASNLTTIVGNIGKSFVDELAVGATEAASGMIKFLASAQGAQVVSDVIAGVTAGFTLLKKILTPIFNVLLVEGKELFESIGGAIENVGGGTAEAAGAFNILSFGVNIITGGFRILSTILQAAITSIGNVVKAVRLSGGVIDDFFKVLSGKKKWKDVANSATAAGEAFKDLALGYVDGYVDIFSTIIDEATEFQKKVEDGAKDMDVTIRTSFETTKKSVMANHDEMITGQENLTAAVVAGAENMNNALTTAMDNSAEENKIAQEEIKKDILSTEALAYASTVRRNEFESIASAENAIVRTELANQLQTDELARQEELRQEWEKTANQYISLLAPTLESLGGALVNNWNVQQEINALQASSFETTEEFLAAQNDLMAQQTDIWSDVKKAALNSIAAVVRAFGEKLAIMSAEAFFAGNIVSGIGFAAASASAFVAAGIIPALATGGTFSGPALVGENGPEIIFSEDRARVISNRETESMLRGGGGNTQISPTYNIYTPLDIDKQNRNLGYLIQGTMRKI